MPTISESSIYSTEEEVTKRHCILWEIIRRHPDYVEFCMKHKHYFDMDKISFLDEMKLTSDEKIECQKIKKRFGLEHIVDPNSSIPEQTMKAFRFFRDEHSVDPELMERQDGTRTPVWEDRFVRLWIDIRAFRTKKEIQEEVWNTIEWARRARGINPAIRRPPSEESLEVWDMKIKGLSHKDIIQQVWPDEYNREFGSLSDSQRDKLYEELINKYRKEGIKNYDERAWAEAYSSESGESESGKARLYMRVGDKVKRMVEIFKEFFPP